MIDVSRLGNSLVLVGCVFGNDDESHTVMLPDKKLPENGNVVDATVDDWVDILYQTDRIPVEALVQGDDALKPGKAMLFKSQRQISQHVSWAVFRRDNFSCRYCGCEDKPLTVDHLVLWEDGGPSIEDNLVASCGNCNRTRGSTAYAEWLQSKYYKKVSADLPHQVQFANQALIPTLTNIEVTPINQGKKRKRR